MWILDLLHWIFVKRTDYYQYIRSWRWKAKTQKRREKDRFICQRCGARGWQVHHKTYKRLGHEWICDLETLCPNCHKYRHGIKR